MGKRGRGGAPTAYRPEYCEAVISHMAEGYSFESFAGKVRVSRDTVYEWAKVHAEFSDAKKIGVALSLLWWENAGRSRDFQPAIWIFNMKNRFGWRDVQHLEHGGKVEQTITEKRERVESVLQNPSVRSAAEMLARAIIRGDNGVAH